MSKIACAMLKSMDCKGITVRYEDHAGETTKIESYDNGNVKTHYDKETDEETC